MGDMLFMFVWVENPKKRIFSSDILRRYGQMSGVP
jgi:hypothetical protein